MTITRDQSIGFTSVASGRNKWSTGFDSGTTSHVYVVPCTRTRTGTRLPHWKQVIASGNNATTPLTATWDTVSISPAHFTYTLREKTNGTIVQKWSDGDIVYHNSNYTLPTCPNPVVSATFVDNLARAAFYKKLRSINTKFAGLTFLGELKESLHMLRKPARALYDSAGGYLAALGKAKRASPKDWTKVISGLWLEHSFGWQPLINDTRDAIKAYDALKDKTRQEMVSAGAIKRYDNGTSFEYWPTPSNGCALYLRKVNFEDVIVRYKGKLSARADATSWDNYALFGFSPREVIPTAWELLPWSFLADYFTNIGDILESTMAVDTKLDFTNRTELHLCRRNTYGSSAAAKAVEGTNYAVVSEVRSQSVVLQTRKTVSRSAVGSIPLPSFQLSVDLTDGQLGNIAALLGQARALHPQQAPRPYRYGGRPY